MHYIISFFVQIELLTFLLIGVLVCLFLLFKQSENNNIQGAWPPGWHHDLISGRLVRMKAFG